MIFTYNLKWFKNYNQNLSVYYRPCLYVMEYMNSLFKYKQISIPIVGPQICKTNLDIYSISTNSPKENQ